MARIDAFLEARPRTGLLRRASGRRRAADAADERRPVADQVSCAQSDTELESYINEILTKNQQAKLQSGQDIDFSYVGEEGGRFRVNVFRKATGYGAVFRHIPTRCAERWRSSTCRPYSPNFANFIKAWCW